MSDIIGKIKDRLLTRRAFVLILFIVLYFFSAFFWQHPSVNSIPRLGETVSLVKRGELALHPTAAKQTIDKAVIDGKYYNDKAPLGSLMLLPIYGLHSALSKEQTGPQAPIQNIIKAHRLALLYIYQPMFAAFVLWLILTLLKDGVEFGRAFLLAACLSFGTYLYPSATVYFGHIIAAFFLFAAYLLQREGRERFFLSGLLTGMAVATEYTTALFGIAVGLDTLIRLGRKSDWKGLFITLFWFGLGSVPGFLIVFGHNVLITGKPLLFPYAFEEFKEFQAMQQNMGFRTPSFTAVYELIFSQHRGLLFYIPALLVGLPLLARAALNNFAHYRLTIFSLVLWLTLISSFYLWDGGSYFGPRYLVAPTFFLLYEVARLLGRIEDRRLVYIVYGLGAFGLFCALAVNLTTILIAREISYPFGEYVWPALLKNANPEWGSNFAYERWEWDAFPTMALWVVLFVGAFLGLRWYHALVARESK